MIWNILVAGGLLFWLGLGIITLVLANFMHNDQVGRSATLLVVTVALLVGFTSIGPALKNVPPIYYLYAFLAYLGGAMIWTLIKWRVFFLPKLFDRYAKLKYEFLQTAGPDNKPLKEMPADKATRDKFAALYDVQALNINQNRMVRRNKGRITSWMIFWPFSLIETFFGDFLSRVFETIYKGLSGLLQRMSDGMASKHSELA